VAFSVDPNTTSWSRIGSLTIAGTVFSVTQEGPCAPTISPTSQSFASAGSVGTSTVTAADWCNWTAVSNSNWITVIGGAAGTGNGSVSFIVDANTSTSSRTGTLTIAGATFTVTQQPAGATCSASLSPSSQSFAGSGGPGSIGVTAPNGCAWTAVSGASWISVTGAIGNGNGTATYSVAANTGTSSRTGTITIGGATFTVTQGVACSYTLSPSSLMVAAPTSTGTIGVTTQAGCSWSASSTIGWITLSGSGSGNGSATYTIAANTTATARSATVFIGGQAVSVMQAAPTKPLTPLNLVIKR